MTLPAKNRKRLRFENESYRYVFTAHKTLDFGRLMVELERGNCPLLIVQWRGVLQSKRDIVPRRYLCAAINYAIGLGWLKSTGSQLEIGCDASEEELVFFSRPKKAQNSWFLDRYSGKN